MKKFLHKVARNIYSAINPPLTIAVSQIKKIRLNKKTQNSITQIKHDKKENVPRLGYKQLV